MLEGLNSEDLFHLLAKLHESGYGLTLEEANRFVAIMDDIDLARQVDDPIVMRRARRLLPKVMSFIHAHECLVM